MYGMRYILTYLWLPFCTICLGWHGMVQLSTEWTQFGVGRYYELSENWTILQKLDFKEWRIDNFICADFALEQN